MRYLGVNVPNEGVIAMAREHRATALGISATMLFSVPRVRRLISDVSLALGARRPRLIVGGSAFRHSPDLYRELGADAVALDLEAALDAFRVG